jgi:hypothetical protein
MRSVPPLLGLLAEMIFILVGWLLLWVALTGRYLFDPRRPSWMLLAAVLILWGAQTWRRARGTAARSVRLASRIGGGSLALVGLILLSLAWMPLGWVGVLLAAAGGVFVVRGLVAAATLALAS